MSLLCPTVPLPPPPPQSPLPQSRPMLPAAAEMQLGAWTAAIPALKVSFRDALAAALSSEVPAQQSASASKHAQLTLQLQMPSLLRDTSTASTPTGSITPSEAADDDDDWQSDLDAASSRCSSPLLCSWPADIDLSSSSSPSSASSLSSASHSLGCSDSSQWSSELIVDFSMPPLDLSTDVEVDWEALEREAQAEAEAAAEAECRLEEAASASVVDPFTELSYRSRHRLIAGCPSLHDRLESTNWAARRSATGRALSFYTPAGKAGSRLSHMQLAARGLDRRGRNHAKASEEPAEVAVVKKGRVPGPYDRLRLRLPAPKAEAEKPEQAQRVQKHSNDKTGAQRAERIKTHQARHSLSADHRPAMEKAMGSFRLLLRERAARKVEIKQAAAAPRQLPKHMRRCSINPAPFSRSRAAKLALLPPAPAVATDADSSASTAAVVHPMRYTNGFDAFRHSFYMRNRDAIETALTGSHRVVGVRLAPLDTKPRQRFMSKLAALAPSENKVALSFHGTKSSNISSICEKGLLVPNRAGNGVRVAHGSALGVGIYSARSAHYPMSFCSGPTDKESGIQTMFVCAAIIAGVHVNASTGSGHNGHCRVSGDVIVLFDEARVAPLFLLDFAPAHLAPEPEEPEPEPQREMKLNESAPPPPIAIQLVRRMLAAAHSKQRKAQAHASKLNKQTVCSSSDLH